ncbi:MAG: CRISPR-associated endonuclease Cas3'', partial [bacterium]
MKLLAKSDPEVTIESHIEDALKLIPELKESFQRILNVVDEDKFWKSLKYSIIFHDLGKSHAEFQKLLIGKQNEWHQQRHELFSLPFIAASNLPEKEEIYYTVAGHHKDFDNLLKKLQQYGIHGVDSGLDLNIVTKKNLTFEENFKKNIPVEEISKILQDYSITINKINEIKISNKIYHFKSKQFRSIKEILLLILLCGSFKQCDHLASAGIKSLKKLQIADFNFLHD